MEPPYHGRHQLHHVLRVASGQTQLPTIHLLTNIVACLRRRVRSRRSRRSGVWIFERVWNVQQAGMQIMTRYPLFSASLIRSKTRERGGPKCFTGDEGWWLWSRKSPHGPDLRGHSSVAEVLVRDDGRLHHRNVLAKLQLSWRAFKGLSFTR